MKRIDLGTKTLLYPMPVLILGTYDSEGNANAMNAAWGGIYDTDKVIVCLSSHKTTDNLHKNMALTISFATEDTVIASDYVGIVSQNKVPNKIAKAGLTPIKSNVVNAPLFEEYPLAIECVVDEFINEGEGGGNIIASIKNVSVREDALDEEGKIDITKVKPIVFDAISNTYRGVGDVIAKAFNVGLKVK